MQINNDIYQTYGHNWWAENAGFDIYSLRYCMNPVSHGYFKRRLQELHLPSKCGEDNPTQLFVLARSNSHYEIYYDL